jgi:LPS export ABC transporter protein LptC
VAIVGLASCQKKEEEIIKKVAYTGPTVETNNVLTLVSDSAKLQIKLKAPLEQTFESGDQIYPQGMLVTFFSDGGKKVANTLSGKYGKFEKSKNLYTVRGDVRVSNVEKQQKMSTEEAFFDKQKGLIYTDSAMFVRVETPTEVLTGYGLTANQDFSRYRIKKPTGIFTVDQPTPAPAK